MSFLASVLSWAAQQAAEPSLMERYVQGLKEVDTSKFLVLSAILFSIGIGGVLIRRNIIVIFMSVELMLSAANLNFIAFARYWQTQGSLYAHNEQRHDDFHHCGRGGGSSVGVRVTARALPQPRNRRGG